MQLVLTLLWSVNDRAGGGPGADLPPPDLGWLNDVILANRVIVEQMNTRAKQQEQKVEQALARAQQQQAQPQGRGRRGR